MPNSQFPIPNFQCPISNAQFPMPNSQVSIFPYSFTKSLYKTW
ncbi:MAG: hypothetical protein V7K98_04295 [Nostoc sp.]